MNLINKRIENKNLIKKIKNQKRKINWKDNKYQKEIGGIKKERITDY